MDKGTKDLSWCETSSMLSLNMTTFTLIIKMEKRLENEKFWQGKSYGKKIVKEVVGNMRKSHPTISTKPVETN